jgi:hypothetical protein
MEGSGSGVGFGFLQIITDREAFELKDPDPKQ